MLRHLKTTLIALSVYSLASYAQSNSLDVEAAFKDTVYAPTARKTATPTSDTLVATATTHSKKKKKNVAQSKKTKNKKTAAHGKKKKSTHAKNKKKNSAHASHKVKKKVAPQVAPEETSNLPDDNASVGSTPEIPMDPAPESLPEPPVGSDAPAANQ